MREYKYRAWHREERQMYWFDVTWGNYEQGNGWIGMVPIAEKKLTYFPSNQTQISPESVELMEYVGLQDKNGIEMYEGDIVTVKEDDYHHLWIVTYKAPCFKLESISRVGWKQSLHLGDVMCPDTIEIIGNIYENIELKREWKTQ